MVVFLFNKIKFVHNLFVENLVKKLKKISNEFSTKKCDIFVFEKRYFKQKNFSQLKKLFAKKLFEKIKNINYKIYIPSQKNIFRIDKILDEIFCYYSNFVSFEKVLKTAKKLNLEKNEINFLYEYYSYKILKNAEIFEKNINFVCFFVNFNKINTKFKNEFKLKKYNVTSKFNFLLMGDFYFFLCRI